jgi:hypothetical protein
VEVPHGLTHALEAGSLRLVHPDGILGPRDCFDLRIPASHELGDGLVWNGKSDRIPVE